MRDKEIYDLNFIKPLSLFKITGIANATEKVLEMLTDFYGKSSSLMQGSHKKC